MIRLRWVIGILSAAAVAEFVRSEWEKQKNWQFVSKGVDWYRCDEGGEWRNGKWMPQCRNQARVPSDVNTYALQMVLCAKHSGTGKPEFYCDSLMDYEPDEWWAEFHREQKLYLAEMEAEEAEERRMNEELDRMAVQIREHGELDPLAVPGKGQWHQCSHGDPGKWCGKWIYADWRVDGYESCYWALCSHHSPEGQPGIFVKPGHEQYLHPTRDEEEFAEEM